MEPNSIQYKMQTEIGDLYLVASEKGLQNIYFNKLKIPFKKDLNGPDKGTKILKQAVKELTEYLQGKRKKFDVALDLKGTDFQRKVWAELLKIPYGETNSYKEVAAKLKTKAYRAVGSANGKNPVCIIVPCHRVIAADGTLGGYSGGLQNKRKLLGVEKIKVKS